VRRCQEPLSSIPAIPLIRQPVETLERWDFRTLEPAGASSVSTVVHERIPRLRNVLFGVGPLDPFNLIGVSLVLVLSSSLACYVDSSDVRRSRLRILGLNVVDGCRRSARSDVAQCDGLLCSPTGSSRKACERDPRRLSGPKRKSIGPCHVSYPRRCRRSDACRSDARAALGVVAGEIFVPKQLNLIRQL
jgi:hypothetical protein